MTYDWYFIISSANLGKISKLLNSKQFAIDEALLKEQDKIIFESMGLTTDQLSMENAALLLQMMELPFGTGPIPLLLDPTCQCLKWLKALLTSQEKSFEVTAQNTDRFTYNLELAVRFGKTLIVQEGHEIVPPLLALIHMRQHNRFAKKMVQVGGKLVDLHENFHLILVTTTTNVALNGDLAALLTLMHFTITALGFTDQLMSKWIVLKKPELEQQRIELLKSEGELLQRRVRLQDQLLEELSTAQGDILKNEVSLIFTLLHSWLQLLFFSLRVATFSAASDICKTTFPCIITATFQHTEQHQSKHRLN